MPGFSPFGMLAMFDEPCPVPARITHVLDLRTHGRGVRFTRRSKFVRIGTRHQTALTAVVADAAIIHMDVIVTHIHIGDTREIDVRHRAVVLEYAAIPMAALVTGPDVAESVVHTTIESDVRPPIARIPPIHVIDKAPVSWRP